MTNKEITIAALEYIERLEGERAALAVWIGRCRDDFGNQPNWRELASNREVLGTVHAGHDQLRQSILLASDDDCPRILVEDMAKRVKK